jgi:hypothetical protein
MRAAQAAMEVVNEECGREDMEIREIEDGMFIEIPSDTATMIDNAGNSPVPLDNFAELMRKSNFIRSWVAGIVTAEGVDNDPQNEEFASRVYTFGSSVFDDPLDFEPSDLVGTDALETVAEAA